MLITIITFLQQAVWPAVVSFVTKYWKFVLAALIVVGGWLYISHLNSVIDEQKHTISTLKTDNQTLIKNNERLEKYAATMSESLSVMAQSSKEIQSSFDRLNGSVQASVKGINSKLAAITSTDKKPATSDEAIKYLLDARREYAEPIKAERK